MSLTGLQRWQIDHDARRAFEVVTEPEVEPVLKSRKPKTTCKVDLDITEDDDLIDGLITTARLWIEDITGRALITQTRDLFLDSWPRSRFFELPGAPLQSVASITYTDEDGGSNTFAASSYIVDATSKRRPGRIWLDDDDDWPTDALEPGASIAIRYTCGYGSAGSDVPRPIRQALLLMVGLHYEHREEAAASRRLEIKRIPFGVRALLAPYRIHR